MIKQQLAALAQVPTDKLLPLLKELVALLETQQAIAPPKQVALFDDLGPPVPDQIRIRLLLDATYLSGVRLIKLLNQHPKREWPALLERMALAGMRQAHSRRVSTDVRLRVASAAPGSSILQQRALRPVALTHPDLDSVAVMNSKSLSQPTSKGLPISAKSLSDKGRKYICG